VVRESDPNRSRISARVGRRGVIGADELAHAWKGEPRSGAIGFQRAMNDKTKTGVFALLSSLAPVLAGLVASAILAVDYLRPTPVFCSEGGGCDAVRRTAYAAVLGVPTPLVGLAGFVAIGISQLVGSPRARVAAVVLASVAALIGVLLLIVQAVLGHFCPYCIVADTSAIATAPIAWWRLARPFDARPPAFAAYAGAGLLAAATIVPVALGWRLGARAPGVIVAEMDRTPVGKVTVVDFVDFECPFCRMTHGELEPILEAHRDRLRVVRRQVPLRMHPHAHDAARAACCAERLGRGEAMANALFAAPVDELTREGCEKVAQAVGLALDPYRACVADPKTDESIEADRAAFKAAGGYALPTIWIDGEQLIGAQPRAALEKALGDALTRAGG
jgi:uncharacterized membrane protein/predicted DsbA family dithiol-disulfide isomerase